MDERALAESQKQEEEDEEIANFNAMIEAEEENEELAGRVRRFATSRELFSILFEPQFTILLII